MITLGLLLLGKPANIADDEPMAVSNLKMFDLTEGPVGGQLTRMTIPYFLGISSMIFASMIETIYIGILGAKELAAYSFMFPVLMALTGVSMGVGVGASSLIARAQGRGDREQVMRITTHTAILTVVLTLLLSASSFLWLDLLFRSMGAKGEVLDHVMTFANIWVPALITFTIPMVCSTVLRALGIAKGPGYVMTISSAMQLVISPVLIFGLFAVPAMGFAGSAWAFIAVGFIRIIALSFLVWRENILLFRNVFAGFIASTREIMHIAIPSMLTSLVGPVSMAITIALLAAHSDAIVAAYGVVSRIEMLTTMVLGALASSVAPFVGQNWGARKMSRIYRGLFLSDRFCMIWGVICFAVLAPYGEPIVSLINDEPELVEAAGWFLIIVPISFGLMGVGQVASSMFIALGKPMPPTILSILKAIVIYIPLAVWFDNLWGYIGIFIALLVSNLLFGIAAFFWGRHALASEIAKRDSVSSPGF